MVKIAINPSDLDVRGSILPIDGLSEKMQLVARTVTDVLQCPQDMVVASMFVVAGTAIGKRLIIEDGKYLNYPCLWVCNIAPSGANKSTPMRTILQPLRDRDACNYKEYRERLKLWKAAGDDKAEKPVFKQLLLCDSTPEARSQVLASNPSGILLFRDELKGMIDDFGRYNRSGELSQLLSIFDADNIIINRKSDDTLLLEKPFMSIMGSIQPSVLNETFGNDLMMGNGFNQRWLFCFPDAVSPAMYSDEVMPSSIVYDWRSFIYDFLINDFIVKGDKLYLRGEAKKVYIKYYDKLQKLKYESDDYMGAVYSKLQICVIRWAGIAHALGNNPYSVDISPEEMEYSCRCMDYFARCAEKVYGILRAGKRLPETKPMGKEQMIANVYHLTNPVSQSAVAEALGCSKQFISKCLKKYPKLTGRRLTDIELAENEIDTQEYASTT